MLITNAWALVAVCRKIKAVRLDTTEHEADMLEFRKEMRWKLWSCLERRYDLATAVCESEEAIILIV